MAVPTFDKMLRPFLGIAAGGDLSRQNANAAMEVHFRPTPNRRAISERQLNIGVEPRRLQPARSRSVQWMTR